MKIIQKRGTGEAKTKRGFTLIETFVAITILLIAIAGPLTIATRGLQSALVARDQITAFYLAQEAIEYIRFRRDSNFATNFGGTPTNWLSGLDQCRFGNTCVVDVVFNTITQCVGTCPELLHDGTFYTYKNTDGNSLPTIFTRSVVITDPVADVESTVTVTVGWKTGKFTKSIQVQESITNMLNAL